MLADMDFEQRYRAVATRDARFDGAFVLAVRTTGIYCRPSCPARTPKPANVEFFPTSAAAHVAGYRACKRCLPEAVPGSPEWNLRSDTAARAMRLIADGVVERDGVPGLAARLGYTTRHLSRLLSAELGAGPLSLARAHRAQTARELLISTELPIAEIAFAAGFGSIRQFNDTIAEIFGRAPAQLRTGGRHHRAGGSAALQLSVPVREPFDTTGVFAWLTARAIPGVETAGPDSYGRSLALPGGPASFDVTAEAGHLRLTARLSRLEDVTPLLYRVRRLFDADADPVGIDAALSQVPELDDSVTATPGIRLPGAVDPQEMLFRALVGQQISVAAARTQLTRLTDALGTRLPVPDDAGRDRLFPTAAAIAEAGREVLVGPRQRIENIIAIADRLATGELELGFADDPAEQRRRLLAQPGIGEWTADYLAMRVLGDPDILPVGDVAVRTGAKRLGLPDRPAALRDWGRTVSPWRSYASLHLWRASATKELR
jgi:Adenosine deaminase